jgi:thiamine monophosphate kinase
MRSGRGLLLATAIVPFIATTTAVHSAPANAAPVHAAAPGASAALSQLARSMAAHGRSYDVTLVTGDTVRSLTSHA